MLPEDLPALTHPQYADALDKAAAQIQTGRYRLALQTLRTADAQAPRTKLLQAQAFYQTGEFTEALLSLSAIPAPQKPDAQILQALCQSAIGKRQDAVAILTGLIDDPNAAIIARCHLARLLDETGHASDAIKILTWFDDQKFLSDWQANQLDAIESPDVLVAVASALDRLAVLRGDYRNNNRLHQTVLAMFVRAYDVLDRRHADAHVRAAEFFVRHDDLLNARQEVAAARRLNPNDIDALALSGQLALDQYDFDTCEKVIASILAINPDHAAAALLTADMLIMQRAPDDALNALAALLSRDPENPQAMARLAACDAMRMDKPALTRRLEQYRRLYPQSAMALITAGRLMEDAVLFKDAIPLLQDAIALAPNSSEPRNLLAIAYMHGTATEKARPILEAARELDPFNVATTNYLRLLDSLRGFQFKRSEHFAVRYSEKSDPFLPDEILAYMEGNYWRICGEFAHEPGEPTVIELMPTKEDFSVRTAGKPWIGTIGASTGPVITLVAPRKNGKTDGPFDWCDVTRHEFVHTVTISATNARIPRWFTEGLAVSEQVAPLNAEQAMLLAKATNSNQLFPLRRINWAFIRPRRKTDTTQAYGQSHWLCRYITEKFGHAAILRMIQSFEQGKQIDQVIQQSLGISSLQLDAQFADWAAQQVKTLGLDANSQTHVAALKDQGEKLLKDQDLPAALVVWKKAYAICAIDPQVNQRLAGLYLHNSINRPTDAIPHLRALDRNQLKNNRYALRLAQIYQTAGQFADAIPCARRATQIDPYDPAARDLLARVLDQARQPDQSRQQRQILDSLQ